MHWTVVFVSIPSRDYDSLSRKRWKNTAVLLILLRSNIEPSALALLHKIRFVCGFDGVTSSNWLTTSENFHGTLEISLIYRLYSTVKLALLSLNFKGLIPTAKLLQPECSIEMSKTNCLYTAKLWRKALRKKSFVNKTQHSFPICYICNARGGN